MRFNLKSQRGFTLVEVLTVMLVLVAIASITVESTKDFVFQGRYDITKDRYEKIKKAIVGDPNQVINGQPNIEGFVKDVGRLPNNLDELKQISFCKESPLLNETDCGTQTKTWITKSYISGDISKDGWGNTFQSTSGTNTLRLYSQGKDGTDNGTNYDADYPSTNNVAINTSDWQININGFRANVMASGFKGYCSAITSETSCTSAGGTWLSSQPTSEVICKSLNGIWSGSACSGVSLPVCSISKSVCESIAVNGWSYFSSSICMKITDNRLTTPTITNILSTPPIKEDGREHAISFPFFNDANTNQVQDSGEDDIKTPLGSVSVGIYKDCGTALYGLTTQEIKLTLHPNTTLPTINW